MRRGKGYLGVNVVGVYREERIVIQGRNDVKGKMVVRLEKGGGEGNDGMRETIGEVEGEGRNENARGKKR